MSVRVHALFGLRRTGRTIWQLHHRIPVHVFDFLWSRKWLVQLVILDMSLILGVPQEKVGDARQGIGRRTSRCDIWDSRHSVLCAEHFVQQHGGSMNVLVADLHEQRTAVGEQLAHQD